MALQKNLLSAAVIAAAASMPAPAMAMSPHPSCDFMLADMAAARDAALQLENTDFYLVNWVMNTFAPGYSKRAGRLAALKVANLNVNMAGGGSGGYFSMTCRGFRR